MPRTKPERSALPLPTSSVSSPVSDDATPIAVGPAAPGEDRTAGSPAAATAPATVGRNSILMVGGTLTARLCAFIATIICVRLLVQDAFAVVVLAQAAVAYLTMILDFGLTMAGMRAVAQDPTSLPRISGTVLVVRTAVAVIGVAVTAAVGVVLGLSQATLAVLLLFAGAAAVAALDLSWILQGLHRMGLRAVVVAGTALLNLGLLVAFLAVWRDPLAVALASFIATCAVVASGAVLVVRSYGMPALPDPSTVRILILASLPLGLGMLLAQVYYNFDVLLLGALRPLSEVAVYGAIYKIVLGMLMLAGTYGIVCLPAYAAAHMQSESTFRRILQRNVRLLSAVIVPVVILGTIAAESLAVFFFGDAYRSGGAPLAILLWSVALSFVSSTFLYALAAAGRGWLLTWAAAAGASVNVAMNLVLIPRFGMIGAAWATVGAELTVLIVAWRGARQFALSGLSRHLLLLIPPAVAMVAISLLLAPFSRGIGAGVGFVIFVLIAAVTGVWTADDRRMLRSVVTQLLPQRSGA